MKGGHADDSETPAGRGRTTRRRGRHPSTTPEEIPLDELMTRLALSHKQIQREMAEGMPHRRVGRALRFPWPEARLWRDEHIRDQAAAASAPKPAQLDARSRRAEAEATLAELALEERRGNLMPVEAHVRLLEDAFSRVRARLIALKPRLGANGIGHKTPTEAVAALAPLIDEAMAELHAATDVPEPIEDSPPAAAEEAAPAADSSSAAPGLEIQTAADAIA